ncbi:hypothetical protein ABBQ38_010799 [Trebouxia sp. C0009 RCD-2024]
MQQWEALPLLKAAMLQANEDAVLKLREEARQHMRRVLDMHKAQLDEPTMRSLMKQAETRNAVLPVVNAAMRHSDDEEQLLTRADHLRNRAHGEAKERAVDAKKVNTRSIHQLIWL